MKHETKWLDIAGIENDLVNINEELQVRAELNGVAYVKAAVYKNGRWFFTNTAIPVVGTVTHYQPLVSPDLEEKHRPLLCDKEV